MFWFLLHLALQKLFVMYDFHSNQNDSLCSVNPLWKKWEYSTIHSHKLSKKGKTTADVVWGKTKNVPQKSAREDSLKIDRVFLESALCFSRSPGPRGLLERFVVHSWIWLCCAYTDTWNAFTNKGIIFSERNNSGSTYHIYVFIGCLAALSMTRIEMHSRFFLPRFSITAIELWLDIWNWTMTVLSLFKKVLSKYFQQKNYPHKLIDYYAFSTK